MSTIDPCSSKNGNTQLPHHVYQCVLPQGVERTACLKLIQAVSERGESVLHDCIRDTNGRLGIEDDAGKKSSHSRNTTHTDLHTVSAHLSLTAHKSSFVLYVSHDL
ncbi:unnamed protein product [Leuciscus chuanchicus]